VNPDLDYLLRRQLDVITRAAAAAVVPLDQVDYAIRAGHIVRVHRGVYARPPVTSYRRRRAALIYCGGRAVLSHLTALALWGLWEDDDASVHVTIGTDKPLTGVGLVVHRHEGFAIGVEPVRYRDGLPVTSLEHALVDSWPLLPGERRREPVIRAVTGRRTTTKRVRKALEARPRLVDRQSLARLLYLLEIGCHSPLEIWGYEHIFNGPDMPEFRRQVPVRLDGRLVYLDVFAEEEKVNFELDGRDGHVTKADRERDLRRDAALAARGILVVRFTHYRLTHEPEAVRLEILAILAVRKIPAEKSAKNRPGNH
jgi:very-short-patch-repair endonuclease